MINSVAENLRKYFENTSREQIERDWVATQKFDEIGPTVTEFLSENALFSTFALPESYWEFDFSFLNKIENPKVTSDFFFTLGRIIIQKYGQSNVFIRELFF